MVEPEGGEEEGHEGGDDEVLLLHAGLVGISPRPVLNRRRRCRFARKMAQLLRGGPAPLGMPWQAVYAVGWYGQLHSWSPVALCRRRRRSFASELKDGAELKEGRGWMGCSCGALCGCRTLSSSSAVGQCRTVSFRAQAATTRLPSNF